MTQTREIPVLWLLHRENPDHARTSGCLLLAAPDLSYPLHSMLQIGKIKVTEPGDRRGDGRITLIHQIFFRIAVRGYSIMQKNRLSKRLTKRRRSPEAARNSAKNTDELYRLVTEAIAEGVYDWSIETDHLELSVRLTEMFGFKKGELTSKNWLERIHTEDRDRYRDATIAYFKGEAGHFSCEYRILDKRNVWRWVSDRANSIRGVNGRVLRLIGAVSDISELKLRETQLNETLQQHATTAEVLKAISRSTFDLQAVLDTLVESAARLSEADHAWLFQQEGDHFRWVASFGHATEVHDRIGEFFSAHKVVADRGSVTGRAVLERRVVHIPDVLADRDYTYGAAQAIGGYRATLGVPLLREGTVIGVIFVAKIAPQPFTQRQIDLVTVFADQAVIAMENTRLLTELRQRTDEVSQALGQQTATSEVLKVISRSAFDLQVVLDTLTKFAAQLCDAEMAGIVRPRGEAHFWVTTLNFPAAFMEFVKIRPILRDRGSVAGRVLLEGRVVHSPDVLADPDFTFGDAQKLGGYRTVLGVPLLREGNSIGVIILTRHEVRPFTDKQIELLSTFADQAVIAIENVRLFDEIQETSRQLEEASKHKSQFLANMSHELRTPLNAIIGYTELILDGIYGETPEKTLTVLKRVESNGRHLLGLINDVLDFSKIEAGQLKLALADYSMKDVVHKVYSAVEPLAAKKNLGFKLDVPPDMPAGHGDEQKLTQVLLNLVGNAIKFTDTGEVTIKVAPANGSFSVAVHDTGPGIDPANQEKLFEEFQQADNSITKAKGGTGLGLAISRRIIEMHGGRLWVDSSPGNGAIFTFTIPTVVEQASPS